MNLGLVWAGFSGSCSSYSPSFPAWAPSFELGGHLSQAQLPPFRTPFSALHLCHSYWPLIAFPAPCLRSHVPGCAFRIPSNTQPAPQPSHTTTTGGSLPLLALLVPGVRAEHRVQLCALLVPKWGTWAEIRWVPSLDCFCYWLGHPRPPLHISLKSTIKLSSF